LPVILSLNSFSQTFQPGPFEKQFKENFSLEKLKAMIDNYFFMKKKIYQVVMLFSSNKWIRPNRKI
jgi:hypothetical protein